MRYALVCRFVLGRSARTRDGKIRLPLEATAPDVDGTVARRSPAETSAAGGLAASGAMACWAEPGATADGGAAAGSTVGSGASGGTAGGEEADGGAAAGGAASGGAAAGSTVAGKADSCFHSAGGGAAAGGSPDDSGARLFDNAGRSSLAPFPDSSRPDSLVAETGTHVLLPLITTGLAYFHTNHTTIQTLQTSAPPWLLFLMDRGRTASSLRRVVKFIF